MELTREQIESLLSTLKNRFQKNNHLHKNLHWEKVQERLLANSSKLVSLLEMEETGGEPDVVGIEEASGKIIFFDCAPESPKGRRSLCYDHEALESRKNYKPKNSALRMAEEMGIEVLTEEQYHDLQKLGNFDTKTSSWVQTPAKIRKLGGAIFGDWRFGRVFIYHNGAESYYGGRGFRGVLTV